MLTTKKGGLTFSFFFSILLLLFFLSGCAESGPHALFEGERLINEGKYPEAVVKLQKAVELLPRNAQAWNHLAVAYHNAGNVTEAVKAYKHALEIDRNLAVVHFNLGCLYYEQGNFPAATASLTTYVAWDPQNNAALLKLGEAQVRTAMQLASAEKVRALDVARKTFETSLALQQTAEGVNGLGMVEAARGRPRDALKYFNNALQKDPTYAPAMLNLGITYQQLNDPRTALQRYREFLASQPRSTRQKEIEDMARQLDSDLNPTIVSTPVNPPQTNKPAPPPAKIVAKEKEKEKERTEVPAKGAETLIAKTTPPAITIPPPEKVESTTLPTETQVKPAQGLPVAEPPQVKETVARTETPAPTPRAEPQPPVRTFPKYTYLSPARPKPGKRADAMVSFNDGLKAQRTGDFAKAGDAYRKALKADPSLFEAYYNLSLMAAQSRQWDEALKQSEMALSIKPDSTDARFNFALALQNAGYDPQAAAEYEQILKQNENDARAHLAVANLYAQRLGQPSKAKPHYQKVIDIEPKHPQSMAIRYWLNEH